MRVLSAGQSYRLQPLERVGSASLQPSGSAAQRSRHAATVPIRVVMTSRSITHASSQDLAAAHDRAFWRLYRPLIWLFAIASILAWWQPPSQLDWQTVGLLILLGNLADLFAVRIQAGMRVSSAHYAAPLAIVAAGVFGGILTSAGCLLGRLILNRRDWNAFDLAVNVTATSVGGLTWMAVGTTSWGSGVFGYVLVITAFALSRSIVNFGWSLEARSKGVDIPAVSGQVGRLMLAGGALFTPALAVWGSERDQLLGAVTLLVLPFIATQFMVRAFGREIELKASLEEANISLTESLVNALDARDPFCAGHSVAVAVYSRDIALEIGLDARRAQRIYLAGLLHDIGKIAVPDAVLSKPAALTEAEWDAIRKHPEIGEQILAPSSHYADVLPGVRSHHERVDGRGYPDGLRDERIPLEARIIAVADAYNGMTSDRPYRDAMRPDLAMRVLEQNQGMQHDPYVVNAFRRVLASRDRDYALATGPLFGTSALLDSILARQVRPRRRAA